MKRISAFLPVLVWMTLIFYMSSRPAVTTSTDTTRDFLIKKTAHVVEYSVLTGLCVRALLITSKKMSKKSLACVWLLVVLFAASDEIHQNFTPTRQPRIRDVAIDSAASLTTLLVISQYYRIKHTKTIG